MSSNEILTTDKCYRSERLDDFFVVAFDRLSPRNINYSQGSNDAYTAEKQKNKNLVT